MAVLLMVACGETRQQEAFPPGDREADYAAVDLSAVEAAVPASDPGMTLAEAAVPVDHDAVTVAEAAVRRLRIYRHAEEGEPWRSIRNPGPFGVPPVFLVRAERDGWLRALLPMEPNGSEGWLRERDVRLSTHDFRVEVDLTAHRLVAFRSGRAFLRQPVAVGTSATPTPTGTYFTTVLVRPDDPAGPYGPFAIGLSAYSEALDTFAGGDGQVAIHGTNSPWLLGQAASHGCIRLRNDAIRRLARVLPAGTPVRITR
jgi:lipoprotein-anchoring transpeptidase ErfK/SrfK